ATSMQSGSLRESFRRKRERLKTTRGAPFDTSASRYRIGDSLEVVALLGRTTLGGGEWDSRQNRGAVGVEFAAGSAVTSASQKGEPYLPAFSLVRARFSKCMAVKPRRRVATKARVRSGYAPTEYTGSRHGRFTGRGGVVGRTGAADRSTAIRTVVQQT